jgi:putative DNA primase/helicase
MRAYETTHLDPTGIGAKIGGASSNDVALRHLTTLKTGTYRGRCPNCNRAGRDDALAITVKADGKIVYFCHRCHFSGRDSSGEHHPAVPPPRYKKHRQTLSDYGRELWNAACPIAGDARAYLESRNCVVPPADGHLRWCERLRHPCGHIGPALVALVTDALTGVSMSLHRTWVMASGRKAAIESPRLLLAGHRKTGGVIRLWPDEEVTCRLGVAEGIETALAAAHGFTPIWAAIDAGNLGALPLLPAIESLTIFADHDDVGLRAAVRLASRWAEAGREVLVVTPEREGHDIADEVNT